MCSMTFTASWAGRCACPPPPAESGLARRPASSTSWCARPLEAHVFNSILTPNYNPAHKNHFHLELTPDVDWFMLR